MHHLSLNNFPHTITTILITAVSGDVPDERLVLHRLLLSAVLESHSQHREQRQHRQPHYVLPTGTISFFFIFYCSVYICVGKCLFAETDQALFVNMYFMWTAPVNDLVPPLSLTGFFVRYVVLIFHLLYVLIHSFILCRTVSLATASCTVLPPGATAHLSPLCAACVPFTPSLPAAPCSSSWYRSTSWTSIAVSYIVRTT